MVIEPVIGARYSLPGPFRAISGGHDNAKILSVNAWRRK